LRIARKEVRVEIQPLKQAATSHRSEIAALKRRGRRPMCPGSYPVPELRTPSARP